MLESLDAEIAAARQRIMREVYRRLSFDKRSAGQKKRWAREALAMVERHTQETSGLLDRIQHWTAYTRKLALGK